MANRVPVRSNAEALRPVAVVVRQRACEDRWASGVAA
mgnify:CR=1 FL=1